MCCSFSKIRILFYEIKLMRFIIEVNMGLHFIIKNVVKTEVSEVAYLSAFSKSTLYYFVKNKNIKNK